MENNYLLFKNSLLNIEKIQPPGNTTGALRKQKFGGS